MTGLVLELQSDALKEGVSILTLLRKAKALSVKLNITSIDEWLEHELNGYPEGVPIPEYRHVLGKVVFKHPYQSWMPLGFKDPESLERLSKRELHQPISALCQFTEAEDRGDSLLLQFPPKIGADLMKSCGYETGLEVALNLVNAVISTVHNKILAFALELEKQDILGDGMTFTKEEKMAASNITYSIHVEKMEGSQIQQGTTNSTQNYTQTTDLTGIGAFVETLLPAIGKIDSSVEREQIRSDLETIRNQIKAPTPKLGIIRECLTSVKTTLEGAAGNVIAAQFLPLIPTLLASIIN